MSQPSLYFIGRFLIHDVKYLVHHLQLQLQTRDVHLTRFLEESCSHLIYHWVVTVQVVQIHFAIIIQVGQTDCVINFQVVQIIILDC